MICQGIPELKSRIIQHLISTIIFWSFVLIPVRVFPQTFEWGSAVPEEEGFMSAKLTAIRDTLANHRTTSLLIIRNDKIILEWYADGWDVSRKHYTASLAKALVGGLSLSLALNDGKVQVDDPASKYIPAWKSERLKSLITIRHLATHSSGIEDAELNEQDIKSAAENKIIIKDAHMDIPGWKGAFWRRDPDPFSVARDYAPVIFAPGSSYQYSNPGMAMLSYVVTASYSGTKYKDIRTLLRERVYGPIGIKDEEWDIGYGKTYRTGGLDLVANWGGGSFTARAVARIGRLMLRKGNWEGMQLIDTPWVEKVTQYAGTPVPPRDEKQPAPACGLGWYNNFDGIWRQAPRDLFLGSGAGNQTLIVIPSMKMIIVRNGENMFDADKGEGHFFGYVKYLLNPLMDAFMEPPYPYSSYIKETKFEPPEKIVRKACDSDNWPITWGSDDYLYTAYGDGTGFEPKVENKLSLGLAKISGDPENFQGTNLRTVNGEMKGDGRSGMKASSLLMVKGILYMWLRNANGNGQCSKLAWSADSGSTWSFSDWSFTEGFGYPAFLNFGKDYTGSRDGYVYIYSHDDIDAYMPADNMIMARVPVPEIYRKEAYEFFKGLDKKGRPEWTSDISERGAVFSHPAHCYRQSISYNYGLKRYLWCQIHPESGDQRGPRYQGGFGIYEAPEPWGPWKTVFYTRDWDTGPGDTSSLPVKWMSKDGKKCYLVFSGNDCFSVRKVIFNTGSEGSGASDKRK